MTKPIYFYQKPTHQSLCFGCGNDKYILSDESNIIELRYFCKDCEMIIGTNIPIYFSCKKCKKLYTIKAKIETLINKCPCGDTNVDSRYWGENIG